MEAMREAWTDERLNDLTHRVDLGFEDNKREFQAMRMEFRAEFQAVRTEVREESKAVRQELREEFQAVRAESNAMHRNLLQVVLGTIVTMLVGFATTIAVVIAQA